MIKLLKTENMEKNKAVIISLLYFIYTFQLILLTDYIH